jgi:uncharacterized protein (TIGR00156 family)
MIKRWQMKKIIFLIFILFISNLSLAGFKGPADNKKLYSVSSVKQLSDDTDVSLEGYITKRLSNDEYLFKDHTGEIQIEIDEKDFRGINVTPKDKIIINGEVDKEFNSIKIDVEHIDLIK